jgi:hypothetical protein
MWKEWRRRAMPIECWWESQKEKKDKENQGVGGLNNIKIYLREIGWDDVDWINLA